jgi:hypothetical protein
MRRVALIIGVGALAALAIVIGACSNPKSETAPTTAAETHTITGTFKLQGSALADTEAADPNTPNENFTTDKDLGLSGNGCQGTNGHDDVAAGLQVNVANESGTTIATGSLEQGEVVKDQFWNNCVFPFTVSNVPTAKFYRIEAGRRGQVSYSYEQMQANSWRVSLSLG